MIISMILVLLSIIIIFYSSWTCFLFSGKRQDLFEKKITEQWDAMTPEEQKASGRENKYC